MSRLIILVGAVIALSALPGRADTLRLATWNIGWLTDKPATHPDVPDHVVTRTSSDFRLVRKYVDRLNADIVAFQEVDGENNAAKVFDPRRYDIHITSETDIQRPGFAIRKGIRFQRHPDFAELDVIPNEVRTLRRGADISVETRTGTLRLLAVHLKSGCPDGSVRGINRDCKLLFEQLPILKKWIKARVQENVPYALLGDFNRQFGYQEPFWKELNQGTGGLFRVTEGLRSPCWG